MSDGDGDQGAHDRPQRGVPGPGRDREPEGRPNQADVEDPSEEVDDPRVEVDVRGPQRRLQHGDPRDRADADGDREGVDGRGSIGSSAARPHDRRRRGEEGDGCAECEPCGRVRKRVGPAGPYEELVDQGRRREEHDAQRQQDPRDAVPWLVPVHPEQDRDRHEPAQRDAELPWGATGHGCGHPGNGGDVEP